ncbi:6881_t:CDS:1, partial [Dentiscutata erythropus]
VDVLACIPVDVAVLLGSALVALCGVAASGDMLERSLGLLRITLKLEAAEI